MRQETRGTKEAGAPQWQASSPTRPPTSASHYLDTGQLCPVAQEEADSHEQWPRCFQLLFSKVKLLFAPWPLPHQAVESSCHPSVAEPRTSPSLPGLWCFYPCHRSKGTWVCCPCFNILSNNIACGLTPATKLRLGVDELLTQ